MHKQQIKLLSYKDFLSETRSEVFNDNKHGLTNGSKLFEGLVIKIYNAYYDVNDFKIFKSSINPVIDIISNSKRIAVSVKSKEQFQSQNQVDKIVCEFKDKYPNLASYKLILQEFTDKPIRKNISNKGVEINYFDQLQNLFNSDLEKLDSLMKTLKEATKLGISPINNEKPIEVIEKEFLRCKQLEKELKEELTIPNYWDKIDSSELVKNPYQKFKSSRFILRSIEDKEYPDITETSNWRRTYMYDYYHRGIIIWIDALFPTKVIIDANGNWRLEDYINTEEELPEGSRKVRVRILGLLPYENIVYWQDGDDYYRDYHLFCKYVGIDGTPFEKIEYRIENSFGYFGHELKLENAID